MWSKDTFHQILKYLFLFAFGGALYYCIELLWRGRSDFSMQITAGAIFVYCGLLNEVKPKNMPLWKQVLIGLAFTLCAEFITGCIVNIWLKMDVWDYSNMPFNILGQVCLPYALLFIPLVLLAIWLDDWLRWKIFGEEKPHYK